MNCKMVKCYLYDRNSEEYCQAESAKEMRGVGCPYVREVGQGKAKDTALMYKYGAHGSSKMLSIEGCFGDD